MWSPAAMAGQPLTWASVGAAKEASNHAETAGEKGSSTHDTVARTGDTGRGPRGAPGGLGRAGRPGRVSTLTHAGRFPNRRSFDV